MQEDEDQDDTEDQGVEEEFEGMYRLTYGFKRYTGKYSQCLSLLPSGRQEIYCASVRQWLLVFLGYIY